MVLPGRGGAPVPPRAPHFAVYYLFSLRRQIRIFSSSEFVDVGVELFLRLDAFIQLECLPDGNVMEAAVPF